MALEPEASVQRLAALVAGLLAIVGGIAALKRWGGALALAVVRAGFAHGAPAVDARKGTVGKLDGCVTAALRRDSERKPSDLKNIVDTLYAEDHRRRDMGIEAAHVATAAIDRKVDALMSAIAMQRELMEPLRRMPEVTARLETTLSNLDSSVREVRDELRDHRGQFDEHRQDAAVAAERVNALHERIDQWDGNDRRDAHHPDRRDEGANRRGGGRRQSDKRPN